ncbi:MULTISPECIES: response regulator [Catenuloplanes]|uniref:Two-component system KDP operon response regulator KdpE n=1 Tax=Catenuloplanes niger TaxID=587534 RepID=A0AAE4CXM3_9ACTN|nr:response regulator [Catenuloplanes niger]MDR7324974.1 two-component system KDP operon response regulator KdpE [Catenuloplanes niger]
MTARILLVEDEELNRVLVRAVLARADDPGVRDARLVEAGTLAAARDVLQHPDQVDVVLLDMNLPDGSGLDLATELAAVAVDEKPKVIALTASVLPSDRAAALEAGCDGFLDKPYAAADLVTVIASHLPR